MAHVRSVPRLKTKAHPTGWTFSAMAGQSAQFGRCPHAARAHFDFLGLIILDNCNRLEIRVEAPVTPVHREAPRVAK